MKKYILFIQGGGGEEDYVADGKLVASLKKILGDDYVVHYPHLLTDESAPDFGRMRQIEKQLALIADDIILVGHSLGASMILKYLSENKIENKIDGIFLIATPFWRGDEDWKQGFILREDFAHHLPEDVPVFLYHCKDDEEVPFGHLGIYSKHIPHAIIRELPSGGHQLNNDMSVVARDIQLL
jgi:uncharacterized protein